MVTTNENTYNYVNLDYLDMMADGDADMKKTMLEMLFEELPEEISKMRSLLNEKNWEELGSVSHKMKSTLSFVGNPAMTSSNSDIETICKSDGTPGKVPDLLGVLEDLSPKALEELRKEYDKL